MVETSALATNYIFFLQTKTELDNNYYVLADILGKLNINLLPILADDLKVIERNKKQYLITIRNDLSSAYSFLEAKKSFIDTGMASGKLVLFDISSFSEIENAAKFQNKNVYQYFQLPLNLKQVAMTLAVSYFRERNNNQIEWPGGRRAKLPLMTTES